jgi:hypothetical protein
MEMPTTSKSLRENFRFAFREVPRSIGFDTGKTSRRAYLGFVPE